MNAYFSQAIGYATHLEHNQCKLRDVNENRTSICNELITQIFVRKIQTLTKDYSVCITRDGIIQHTLSCMEESLSPAVGTGGCGGGPRVYILIFIIDLPDMSVGVYQKNRSTRLEGHGVKSEEDEQSPTGMKGRQRRHSRKGRS